MRAVGLRTRSSRGRHAPPGQTRQTSTGQRGLEIDGFRTNATGGERPHHRSPMINVAKRMKHWHTLAQRDPGKRFTDLWKAMTSIEWLTHAWAEIRTNKGSRTPGVDGHTVEDIDRARIEHLSVRLRAGSYRPKPVPRVYIPTIPGRNRFPG